MTRTKTTPALKCRGEKYFNLHESNSAGMDNAFRVEKGRKGFYLYSSEDEPCGPAKTISEAIAWDGRQYSGEYVEIDTNVQLEELFAIMNTDSFEPLLHNLRRLILNGIEIDAQALENFVIWQSECLQRSQARSG